MYLYLKSQGQLHDLDQNELRIVDLDLSIGDSDVLTFVDLEDVDRFVEALGKALAKDLPVFIWDDTHPYTMTLGGAEPVLPTDVGLE